MEIAGKLGFRFCFAPSKLATHPRKDLFGNFEVLTKIVTPTGAANHDVVQVPGPLRPAKMLNRRGTDFWREDATYWVDT